MNYDEKVQLIIIGDSTVGKTSIIKQYFEGAMTGNYLATIGVDHYTKDIELCNKLVRIKVWDTAGQERFKSLTNNFFKNSQGIILVYDITNRETFNSLKDWLASIKEKLGENDVKKVIIGNKVDLPREVSKEEASKMCLTHSISYFETSAKANTGIDEALKNITLQVLSKKMNIEKSNDGGVRLTLKKNGYIETNTNGSTTETNFDDKNNKGSGCGC